MIVVASNDSYLTRHFDLCTCAGNSRSYTFSYNGSLRLKTAWSSLTVWHFFMKRAKEANIIATRITLDQVGFRELKNAL